MIAGPEIAIDVHGLTKSFGARVVVLQARSRIAQQGEPDEILAHRRRHHPAAMAIEQPIVHAPSINGQRDNRRAELLLRTGKATFDVGEKL